MDWGRALAAILIAVLVNVQLIAAGLWPLMQLHTQLANPPPPGSWIYDYFTKEQLDFILKNWNSDKKWRIIDKRGNAWSVGQGEMPPIVAYAIQVYNTNLAQAVTDYMSIFNNIKLSYKLKHGGYSTLGQWGVDFTPSTQTAVLVNVDANISALYYAGSARAYCGYWTTVGAHATFGALNISVYDNGIGIAGAYYFNGTHKFCFNVNPGAGLYLYLYFAANGITDITLYSNVSSYSYTLDIVKLGLARWNATAGKWELIASNWSIASVTNNGYSIEYKILVNNVDSVAAEAVVFSAGIKYSIWYSRDSNTSGNLIYEFVQENPPPWEQNNTQPETCVISRLTALPIEMTGVYGGSGGQEAQWVIFENVFHEFWGGNTTDPDLDQYYHVTVGWAWTTSLPTRCDEIPMQERIDLGEYSWDWNYAMGNVAVDAIIYDYALPDAPGTYNFILVNIIDLDKQNRIIYVDIDPNVTISQGSTGNSLVGIFRDALRPVVSAIKSAIGGALSFAWDLLPAEFRDVLSFLGSFLKDVVVGLVNAILQFPLVLEVLKLLITLFPAIVIAIMIYDPFAVVDLLRRLITLISQVVQAIRAALPLP